MIGVKSAARGRSHGLLRCCAVVGVCLMLCIPLVIVTGSVDATGSGTINDPIKGSWEGDAYYGGIPRGEYYVVIGTYVRISVCDGVEDSELSIQGDDCGLTISYGQTTYLTGTLASLGTTILVEDGVRNWITIHVIEDPPEIPELSFLSDPVTDGIISYGDSAVLIVSGDAYGNQSQEGTG